MKRLDWLVLGLLFGSFLVLQNNWLRIDRKAQPHGDPYAYLTARFINTLDDAQPAPFMERVYEMSYYLRPPLYQLLSVPFGLAFPRSIDGLLQINTCLIALLVTSVFLLGKELKNRNAGYLAAIMVLFVPTLLNIHKMYRPHTMLPAWTALSMLLLLQLVLRRTPLSAWWFGLCCLIGVLVHPNFLFLAGPPALVGIGYVLVTPSLHSQNALEGNKSIQKQILANLKSPFFWKGLLPVGLLILSVVVTWYSPQESLAEFQKTTDNWAGTTYGFSQWSGSLFWYILTAPFAMGTFFSGLTLVSLVYFTQKKRQPVTWMLVFFGMMFLGISVRSLAVAFFWMVGAPLLVFAMLFCAIFLEELREKITSKLAQTPYRKSLYKFAAGGVILVPLTISILNYGVNDWGWFMEDKQILAVLGAGKECNWFGNLFYCPEPPFKENWKWLEVLTYIDEACPKASCSLMVPKVNSKTITYPFLKYLSEINFTEGQVKIIDKDILIDGASAISGVPSLLWATVDFIYIIPKRVQANYSLQIMDLVTSDPFVSSHYEEINRFEMPKDSEGILYIQVLPFSQEEARNIAAKLSLSNETKEYLNAEIESLFSP